MERQIERTRATKDRADERSRGQRPLAMPRPANGLPEDIREHMRLMCDIIALAFQTDKTRVATLLLCRDLSGLFYPFLGVRSAHHPASHNDTSDAYERVSRYYVSQLAYLAGRLADMREGESTVLDNSCLMFISNMWSGSRHDSSKVPVLLVGGLGGTLATGRVLDYQGRGDDQRKLCGLYLSLMRRMGVEALDFWRRHGALGGFVRGEPRASTTGVFLEFSLKGTGRLRLRLAKLVTSEVRKKFMNDSHSMEPLRDNAEEQYRLLMENVKDFAIFLLDRHGAIATWNTGAERITGYQESEIIGKPFAILFPPQAIVNAQPEHELSIAVEKGRSEDERWHVRKDGSQFWASGVVTPLWDEAGHLRGYVKVMRDITARKRAETELADANRRKDEFLAMLAHELRNPLAPIMNTLHVLRLSPNLTPEQTKGLDLIDRQAKHLIRLVDDLLDVSRITQGKIQLRKERTELRTIVNQAIETMNYLVEARKHRADRDFAG